jgi:hypothetical protein
MPKRDVYAIILRTVEYRGDHSAEVERCFECDPNETVGDMLRRVASWGDGVYSLYDEICLKCVSSIHREAQDAEA